MAYTRPYPEVDAGGGGSQYTKYIFFSGTGGGGGTDTTTPGCGPAYRPYYIHVYVNVSS